MGAGLGGDDRRRPRVGNLEVDIRGLHRRPGANSIAPRFAVTEKTRPVMKPLASSPVSGGTPGNRSTAASRNENSPCTLSGGTGRLCIASTKAGASQSIFIDPTARSPPLKCSTHQVRASGLMKVGQSRNKSASPLGPAWSSSLSVVASGSPFASAVNAASRWGPCTEKRSTTKRASAGR